MVFGRFDESDVGGGEVPDGGEGDLRPGIFSGRLLRGVPGVQGLKLVESDVLGVEGGRLLSGGGELRGRGLYFEVTHELVIIQQAISRIHPTVPQNFRPPTPTTPPFCLPVPPELYLMDLSKYSSQRLMAANEVELKAILQEYKSQHLPLWKFGLFVGYNAVSLAGMYAYGVRLRGERVEPSLKERSRFTIPNLFRRGVTHSLIMIGIYSAGLALVCSRTISLSLLQKLTEIQSTYHSFGLKFDPNYQDYLLFSRMRKFDLSEAIIEEIKAELAAERERLVKTGGMLPQTVKKIEEAEELFKEREKELR